MQLLGAGVSGTNAVTCERLRPVVGARPRTLETAPREIIDASTRATNGRRKYMSKKKRKWARLGICSLFLGALVLGGLLLGAQPASALTADVCMQTNYSNHGKTQTLTCTANDVRVATATNISISSGGECHLVNGVSTCTCNANQPVTFTADYQVVLGAQARYDIGIYFGVDGDANNDGALTGTCKLTT